jgi:hypothetical protein
VLEDLPAFFALDGLFQLLQVLGDDLALWCKPVQRLLLFGAAVDVGIAQQAGNVVHRIDHVIGLDRLGEAVIDHEFDVVVEGAEADIAHDRDGDEESQRDGETYPEADADFEIVEHDVVSEKSEAGKSENQCRYGFNVFRAGGYRCCCWQVAPRPWHNG